MKSSINIRQHNDEPKWVVLELYTDNFLADDRVCDNDIKEINATIIDMLTDNEHNEPVTMEFVQ